MRKTFLIILTFLSMTAFTQTPLRSLLGADAVAPACDVDAKKFIDSAGITDATEKSAICTLVTQLKDSSLWSKLYAVYPMVGGTYASFVLNLKDPRNLDAAFRLTILGTPTGASSTGWALPRGNTHFTQSTDASSGDLSMSYYSRTLAGAADNRELGVIDAGKFSFMAIRFTGDHFYGRINGSSTLADGTVTDSRGFFLNSRISTTSLAVYKNGVVLNNNTGSETGGLTTIPMYLGELNNGGAGQFGTSKECAFASIGQGLTAAEALTFYNIVQAFQTALGRQM